MSQARGRLAALWPGNWASGKPCARFSPEPPTCRPRPFWSFAGWRAARPSGCRPKSCTRWRRAVQEQIDELARQALRPGRQHVPPHTNSVLFDDQVDLLLCYTRDLLAGRQPWYWAESVPIRRLPRPTGRTAAGHRLAELSPGHPPHPGQPAATRSGRGPQPVDPRPTVPAGSPPARHLRPGQRLGPLWKRPPRLRPAALRKRLLQPPFRPFRPLRPGANGCRPPAPGHCRPWPHICLA